MFDSILVPVDGSASSDHAVDRALELARVLGSRVTFLHVLEPVAIPFASPDAGAYYVEAIGMREREATEILERALSRARAAGVPAVTTLTREGPPVDAILRAETEHDLTVLGTHGRRGLERFILGSVTEGVLRRSKRPHLVMREPEGAAAAVAAAVVEERDAPDSRSA